MAEKLIQNPGTKHFFTRLPAPITPGQLTLEHLIVAPVYQLVNALDDTQNPLPSARLDWAVGENDESVYRDGIWNANPVVASAPSLRQGATVDPASAELYFQIGSGSARTVVAAKAERNERVLFSQEASYTVSASLGNGLRTITVAGANFRARLEGVPMPGQSLGAGVGPVTFPSPPPNVLTAPLTYLYLPGQPPVLVYGVDQNDHSILYVGSAPVIDPVGPVAGKVRVVQNPRMFSILPDGQRAFVPAGGITPTTESIPTTDPGDAVLYSFDTVDTWTTVGQLGAAVEVDVDHDTKVITFTLVDDGGGDVDTTVSTVAAVNAALREAMSQVDGLRYRNWTPVFFVGEGSFEDEADLDNLTLNAVVPTWTGRLRHRSSSEAGNGLEVSVQVPEGVPNQPLLVERTGDTWFVNLATGSGGLVDLSNDGPNAAKTVAAAFEAVDDTIELVVEDGDEDEAFTPHSLGYWQSRTPFLEDSFTVWGTDPRPLWNTPVALTSSRRLQFGATPGAFMVAGGLLASWFNEPLRATLFGAYRALRVDLSAGASTSRTGNRASLTRITEENIEELLGEITPRNPGALAAWIFSRASGGRPLFVMSPSEVSEADPWGTEEAIREMNEFIFRRNVYHVTILNDAYWMPILATELAESLGGTDTVPLRKAIRYYIPVKNRETAPDEVLANGADALLTDTNEFVGSLDFTTLEVDLGDVVVFAGAEQDPDATVALQDGLRGFRITALNVGGSPYTVQIDGPVPVSVQGNTAFTVYRQGSSLVDPVTGAYLSELSSVALANWHQTHKQPRLAKHLCDRDRAVVRNQVLDLDGVYSLAQFVGRMASRKEVEPMSTVRYPLSRRVEGTHSLYRGDQLARLAGAGLIMPWQESASDEDGPVTVYRDVSSDTSTRIFQRRGAGVAEDTLVLAIDRLLRPNLGPNLVTEQFLTVLSGQLQSLVRSFLDQQYFKVLTIDKLIPITDEIRQQYDIDDSGFLVVYGIRHYEEAAVAINNYVISPN